MRRAADPRHAHATNGGIVEKMDTLMADVIAQRAGGAPASSSAQPGGLQRQPSFSSFPPSRSPSVSVRNDPRKARSPQPPSLPEDEFEEMGISSRTSAQSRALDAGVSGLRSQYPADAV